MIYEIINPSDPYTIDTEDAEAAAYAIIILGGGRYGLRSTSDDNASPLLLFSKNAEADLEAWWKSKFGHSFDSFNKQPDTEPRMAAVLETVLIGRAADREKMNKVFAVITSDDDRRKAMAVYHDTNRSSMNDIGALAWRLARRFRQASKGLGGELE